MEVATLDVLPGEGETKTVTSIRVRKVCEMCGESAHFRYTYLFENFRSNPASSAYRHDDCRLCCDVEVFTCRECRPETPTGCDSGPSRFPATERFAHMFLEWGDQS